MDAQELEKSYLYLLCLPKTGGHYLLIDYSCMPQTGHNNFKRTRQANPGFSLLITGADAMPLWMVPRTQKLVLYLEMDKTKLRGVLKWAGVEILENAVFERRGLLQYTGPDRNVEHALRYDTCVTSEGADFKDSVAVAYGALLGQNSEWSKMDEGEASNAIRD